MRIPVFREDVAPSAKIDQLESYLLLTAVIQGNLTEERVEWLSAMVPLKDRWDHMPEEQWGHLRRTRTETAVNHAKRMVDGSLYDELQDHEWMIKRLAEEIDRMERESVKVSRVYTMIAGG